MLTPSRCSIKVYEMNKWVYDPVVSGRGTKKGKKIVSIADNIIEMGKRVNPTRLKVLSHECVELEPLLQNMKLKLTRLGVGCFLPSWACPSPEREYPQGAPNPQYWSLLSTRSETTYLKVCRKQWVLCAKGFTWISSHNHQNSPVK